MAEWPNASVLKTEGPVRGPWVRILPLPILFHKSGRERANSFARVWIRSEIALFCISKMAMNRVENLTSSNSIWPSKAFSTTVNKIDAVLRLFRFIRF